MKIQILVSSALVDQETSRTAGLYEVVDVPQKRAEFLVSVGAAKKVGNDAKPAPEPEEKTAAPAAEKKAPARRPAPKAK